MKGEIKLVEILFCVFIGMLYFMGRGATLAECLFWEDFWTEATIHVSKSDHENETDRHGILALLNHTYTWILLSYVLNIALIIFILFKMDKFESNGIPNEADWTDWSYLSFCKNFLILIGVGRACYFGGCARNTPEVQAALDDIDRG